MPLPTYLLLLKIDALDFQCFGNFLVPIILKSQVLI